MKIEVMRHWCEHLKLDASGDEADLEERLDAYHQQPELEEHLLNCDCGKSCDGRLPVCPYCGEGDEDGDATDAGSTASPTTTPAKEAPSMAKRSSKKATKKEASKKEPLVRKKKVTKKTTKKVAVTDELEPKAPTSIVPTTGQEVAVVGTEADLDEQVDKIRKLHTAAVVSYWQVGRELHKIFKGRLYVLRTAADGKAKYKAWGQFVHDEFGMSAQHSYRMMEVACTFTREQVEAVGISKLSLLAKVDEAERQSLLAGAESTSFRELTERVHTVTGGKRATKSVSQKAGRAFGGGAAALARGTEKSKAKAAEARAERVAKDPRTAKVTVASMLGRITVPLTAGKKGTDRAMKVQDNPCGREEMANGVKVTYRVVMQSKGLALIVERSRED